MYAVAAEAAAVAVPTIPLPSLGSSGMGAAHADRTRSERITALGRPMGEGMVYMVMQVCMVDLWPLVRGMEVTDGETTELGVRYVW